MIQISNTDQGNLNKSQNSISNQNNSENNQEEHSHINENPHRKYYYIDEIPEFVFSVIKLGKRGFSHKNRLLFITKDFISYYRMVDKNENTKEFLDCLKSIYGSEPKTELDQDKLRELVKKFKNLPEKEKELKCSFNKYTISISENVSSFEKAPITVKNAEERDFTNPTNFWVMETRDLLFREQILKAPLIIKEAVEAIYSRREQDNYNTRTGKRFQKEENKKESPKDEKMIVLNEYKDQIKYIGLLYQGFMKEYLKTICEYSHKKRDKYDKMGTGKSSYNDKEEKEISLVDNSNFMRNGGRNNYNKSEMNRNYNEDINENFEIAGKDKDKSISNLAEEKINDTLKIVYLELAIYYCYDLFVKYCEKVVEKIVYHLGTFENPEDILKTGKLHPIVFPNPSNFTQITSNNTDKQDDNSEPVLLYSIWGVNYTLTWNSLTAKFGETEGTSGKWKKIKHQFQQKNYFQDFLIKLASAADTTEEFPNIPVSCLIDYNGFRVYCESDIFVSEENLESMRLQMNKNDISFIKNIMELISDNNNDDIKKIETSDIYCKIKNENIAEEKGFELGQYIKTMIDEFLKTFEKKNKGNSILEENIKKTDPFSDMQSQKPIVNCIKKLITDDRNIIGITKEHFDDFQNESIEFQKNCTFQYLMYFDVLIPIDLKNKKLEPVYYRQEIAINNINIDKELENLAPKYLQRGEYYGYKTNLNAQEEALNKSNINGGNNNLNYNRTLRSSGRNFQIKKSKEDNDKKNKSPEEIIIDILRKNTFQNNEKIRDELKKKFNQNFENLLMALDSLYLIPYNSETLKICFHYYGINLHFLGKVAERTMVPHVRELCVIEMLARVCKKLIFDLLGQSTYKRAMKAFYSNIKELTTKLHCVPVSLNVIYGSDYLKSITQPVERGKCYYKNMEITGLYMNSEEYPLSEIKDDKEKKNNNEPDYNNKKLEKVSNFLILLFGGDMTKKDLKINGVKIEKVDELWELIKDLMRKQYDITNEDVFMYCDFETISVYSLASAIQYHTGLQIQNEIGGLLDKVMTQKLDNAVFENLSPLPKKCYYSFSYFECKKNVILPLTNNFAMFFPEKSKYYRAKLNYYTEKYLYKKKISQNFYYLNYLKILKGWDLETSPKAGKIQTKNDEFDKNYNMTEYSPVQISPLFEENFDSFIALLMTQYQPKTQSKLHRNDNQENQNKMDLNSIENYSKLISDYWRNLKHPFISLLRSTYAKAMYKNTRNRKEESKIENNFNEAIQIARDSMGELNLFYGKLTRDVGLFYEKNFKFKEAYEMFYLSYKVFKKYKEIFQKDYFYALKNLTKTCVYLGRLRECLKYGIVLVEEITQDTSNKSQEILANLDNEKKKNANNESEKKKNSEYDKKKLYPYLGLEKRNKIEWEDIPNMNGFTFNLMRVAKKLQEFDLCVKIGNIFFSKIKDYRKFKIPVFKNWIKTSQERMKSLSNMRNNQNNKGEIRPNREIRLAEYGGKEKKIDNVIKVYLKCLFRGLKGIHNKTYARAYVAFLENCYNPELNQLDANQINEMFYPLFFRNTNETFDEYFKNKILYFLLQKYKRENLNKEEIEKSYRSARRDLELIYYKFKKNPHKLFLLSY